MSAFAFLNMELQLMQYMKLSSRGKHKNGKSKKIFANHLRVV